ncbi:UDP-galactopyranose mutase [Tunturiibacter empetritectus]|uniref:UDP-galactopyranose mutase n=1 Tax=Tunturiibacter empetritectus TaxID=3069691 RepID=UPI003D9B2BB6
MSDLQRSFSRDPMLQTQLHLKILERGCDKSSIEYSRMKTDILVVGAGFAGAVMAERFASRGRSVLVIDKRPHIGGNAFDQFDSAGVLVHQYGPHIFHTNASHVEAYLSRFTEWRKYEHRVLSSVGGSLYPMPINRETINRLYDLSLDEDGVATFLEGVREKRMPIRNSEDLVLNNVGRDLCDKFFRNYTRKQWGLDLSELSPAVAGRIPVRTNDDDRYFTDTFQNMPADGYTRMFERMLDHPNIRVELETDFRDIRHKVAAEKIFYCGPLDAYFDFCYGKLPYRSLSFRHQHLPHVGQHQPVGTINYPNDYEYTRITEFKHLTGQVHAGTSIVYEYPETHGEPYYPVPTTENQALYQSYKKLADAESSTFL